MNTLTLVSSLIFFPIKNRLLNSPYWIESNNYQLACYYHKTSSAKTIIIFHGNGETASDYLESYVKLFKKYNINILIAEYRGYGASSGTSDLINCLIDAENIVHHVNQSPNNIIVFGRSLGAIPALHIASLFDVSALIIENGVFNIAEWLSELLLTEQMKGRGFLIQNMEDLDREICIYLNSPQKARKYNGALLILHSSEEKYFIPISHAESLLQNARKTSYIKLHQFSKGNHNEILEINEAEYYKEIKNFFDIIQFDNV